MSDRAFLSLENLTLSYGNSIAVDKFNLDIRKGELVAFLGPSGCGKTTTMRSIAGLLTPTSGRITLDGTDITRVSANKRNVGLVFQSYALFPHLTVFENVAFGLRLKRMPAADIEARVTAGLKSVGLSAFSGRKPAELSGGQQQRVALARSMVMEPKVLLLDEPLSNLDARLRVEMRAELQRVQKETGVTMIFVTHDQAEALSLADRIVVMRDGLVEQIGTPEEIYNNPVSSFVADFVGFENVFALKDGKLATPAGAAALAETLPGNAAGLARRPAGVVLDAGPFRGKVKSVSFTGNLREYLLDTPLGPITAEVSAALPVHALGADLAFDLPLKAAAPPPAFRVTAMGVWIDTDMGFDDIAAILVVAHAREPIDGISLVFGNSGFAQVRQNAASAAAAFGWSFPLHDGRSLPVLGRLETAENILSEAGMLTAGRSLPPAPLLPESDAFSALCHWLETTESPRRILALGPLTNIAALALARPDLAKKIDDLTWMGGGVTAGNHTASAEFNAFADPEALAIVLAHGLPLRMVDLDLCRKVVAFPDDAAPVRTAGGRNADLLADLLAGYISIGTSRGRPGMAIYDPCAAVVFVRPELVIFTAARIDVELSGMLTRGRTVVDVRAAAARRNAAFVSDIDVDAARAVILGALTAEAQR